MDRTVKGVLFLDYVRMIRRSKGGDWGRRLGPSDMAIVSGRIDPKSWYPMDVFERLGLAILAEIAGGDVEAAYAWGKAYMAGVFETYEGLVAEGNPMESLMRFKVLERSFFSFEGVAVPSLEPNGATLRIQFHMSPLAEQASAYQTLGFFESMLERAGAHGLVHEFKQKAWEGADSTIIAFRWASP